MKAYESYKPFFSDWVDNIPSHWVEMRLGHLAKIFAGGTPDRTNQEYWGGNIPWINSGSVNQWKVNEAAEYITEVGFNCSSTKWVPAGALVMALAGQGKTKGMCALMVIDATCNQSMAAIVPKDGNVRYLHYWLTSQYKNIRGMASDDLRDGLNLVMVGQIPITYPPINEQDAIADYLDVETARIDGLIEAKHELINLLVEYRQSVISDAVLKGLDPDVPLKPFFSDWVDTIPAHWGQMRLGHIAKIYAGGTPDRTKPEYWDGDIPWINSGSVNQWLVTEASENITHLGWEQSSARWVPKGSLVIALAGQGKTKGMCAQMAIDATCNQSMAAIVPDSGNNRYLLYWLTANYKNIRGMASDDLRDGLNLVMIGQIPIPFPSISEQDAISEYLDIQIAKLDELLKHTEAEIDLLNELRASTIADAVLGRVKVI